jgi:hypothetical protein
MLNKTSIYSYLREKKINRTATEMEGSRRCPFLKKEYGLVVNWFSATVPTDVRERRSCWQTLRNNYDRKGLYGSKQNNNDNNKTTQGDLNMQKKAEKATSVEGKEVLGERICTGLIE